MKTLAPASLIIGALITVIVLSFTHTLNESSTCAVTLMQGKETHVHIGRVVD